MTTVTVRNVENRKTAPASSLAADYKARGTDRQASYSRFVQDRDLSPEMTAAAFFKIFDAAEPAFYDPGSSEVEFTPTHYDVYLRQRVQVTHDGDTGVWRMIWESGHTGGYPPIYPPDWDRFLSLEAQP